MEFTKEMSNTIDKRVEELQKQAKAMGQPSRLFEKMQLEELHKTIGKLNNLKASCIKTKRISQYEYEFIMGLN